MTAEAPATVLGCPSRAVSSSAVASASSPTSLSVNFSFGAASPDTGPMSPGVGDGLPLDAFGLVFDFAGVADLAGLVPDFLAPGLPSPGLLFLLAIGGLPSKGS